MKVYRRSKAGDEAALVVGESDLLYVTIYKSIDLGFTFCGHAKRVAWVNKKLELGNR